MLSVFKIILKPFLLKVFCKGKTWKKLWRNHIKHKIHYTEHIKHVPNDCGNPTHPPTGHQSIKYFAFFTD